MLKVTIDNNELVFDEKAGVATLNGKALNADVLKLDRGRYHVLIEDRSFTIELLNKSENSKSQVLLVNGKKHTLNLSDQYDALLKQLGMDKMLGSKINVLKAPMPGLVLQVPVAEGQEIKKGDTLLVLEAMKMENSIKAAGDGRIKKINVTVKQAVEKNQVLIEFD